MVFLAGDDGLLTCPGGCGEWAPQGLVDRLWGQAAAIDGPPRFLLRPDAPPPPCWECGEPLLRIVHKEWRTLRCPRHGVWFVKDARARFEAELATEIRAHREQLARQLRRREARETLAFRVTQGEHAAVVAMVERLDALEDKVDQLQASLDALFSRPRGA